MRHSSFPPSPWALGAASEAVFAELAVFTYRPDKMKRFSRPENVRPVCKVEKMSGRYAKWGTGSEGEGASGADGKPGTLPSRRQPAATERCCSTRPKDLGRLVFRGNYARSQRAFLPLRKKSPRSFASAPVAGKRGGKKEGCEVEKRAGRQRWLSRARNRELRTRQPSTSDVRPGAGPQDWRLVPAAALGGGRRPRPAWSFAGRRAAGGGRQAAGDRRRAAGQISSRPPEGASRENCPGPSPTRPVLTLSL